MANIAITHRELYLVYKNNLVPRKERKQCVLKFLVTEYGLKDNELISRLKSLLDSRFFNNLTKRISITKKHKRGYKEFETSNSSWLRENFVFSPEENNLGPAGGKSNVAPLLLFVYLLFLILGFLFGLIVCLFNSVSRLLFFVSLPFCFFLRCRYGYLVPRKQVLNCLNADWRPSF